MLFLVAKTLVLNVGKTVNWGGPPRVKYILLVERGSGALPVYHTSSYDIKDEKNARAFFGTITFVNRTDVGRVRRLVLVRVRRNGKQSAG